MTKYNL